MDIDQVIERNFTKVTSEYVKFAKDKDACRQCSIYDCYKQVGQAEGNAKNPRSEDREPARFVLPIAN